MIVDIRARRQRSQAVLVGFEQLGAAAPGMLALAARHREGAVLGEQVRDSLYVATPYAVAIFEWQLANRLAIGQFGCDLFYALGHRCVPLSFRVRSRTGAGSPTGRAMTRYA